MSFDGTMYEFLVCGATKFNVMNFKAILLFVFSFLGEFFSWSVGALNSLPQHISSVRFRHGYYCREGAFVGIMFEILKRAFLAC
jgi:hypothetical protein